MGKSCVSSLQVQSISQHSCKSSLLLHRLRLHRHCRAECLRSLRAGPLVCAVETCTVTTWSWQPQRAIATGLVSAHTHNSQYFVFQRWDLSCAEPGSISSFLLSRLASPPE